MFNHDIVNTASVIESLCLEYCFRPEQILWLHGGYQLGKQLADTEANKHVHRIKTIPVKIPTELPNFPFLTFAPQRALDATKNYSPNAFGLIEYEIRVDGNKVRFWRWVDGQGYRDCWTSPIMLVEKSQLKKFYRCIILLSRLSFRLGSPPVLPDKMLDEIYKNSIQFLIDGKTHRDQYRANGIPYKRGILLAGSPGNGKTLCCRWLMGICSTKHIATKIVTLEDYRAAQHQGITKTMFRSVRNKPCIIFFDDMDALVKNRNQSGTLDIHTFLTEMDGIVPSEGCVFIFTTNCLKELDNAFVRPGRIDLFLTFHKPTEKLRERFVRERFQSSLLSQVNVADIVKKTNDFSFAEIEEIRKVMTMDLMSGRTIDVYSTFKTFEMHRRDFAVIQKIDGFAPTDRNDLLLHSYYDDEDHAHEDDYDDVREI